MKKESRTQLEAVVAFHILKNIGIICVAHFWGGDIWSSQEQYKYRNIGSRAVGTVVLIAQGPQPCRSLTAKSDIFDLNGPQNNS